MSCMSSSCSLPALLLDTYVSSLAPRGDQRCMFVCLVLPRPLPVTCLLLEVERQFMWTVRLARTPPRDMERSTYDITTDNPCCGLFFDADADALPQAKSSHAHSTLVENFGLPMHECISSDLWSGSRQPG
eukprot:5639645-Amphidinium_carterae.1